MYHILEGYAPNKGITIHAFINKITVNILPIISSSQLYTSYHLNVCYGLETGNIIDSDIRTLEHLVTTAFMKIFNTKSIDGKLPIGLALCQVHNT